MHSRDRLSWGLDETRGQWREQTEEVITGALDKGRMNKRKDDISGGLNESEKGVEAPVLVFGFILQRVAA